jgi:hypothetical protein
MGMRIIGILGTFQGVRDRRGWSLSYDVSE